MSLFQICMSPAIWEGLTNDTMKTHGASRKLLPRTLQPLDFTCEFKDYGDIFFDWALTPFTQAKVMLYFSKR